MYLHTSSAQHLSLTFLMPNDCSSYFIYEKMRYETTFAPFVFFQFNCDSEVSAVGTGYT